jgi:hypothetical protein
LKIHGFAFYPEKASKKSNASHLTQLITITW